MPIFVDGVRNKVAITFDVDFSNYLAINQYLDEMEIAFPLLQKLLIKYEHVKTTWFIRIDNQMEQLYGSPDYIFEKHAEKINWLSSHGHEIGWHHHSYKKVKNEYLQDVDEDAICKQLQHHSKFAKQYKITAVRMGWGYHTNKTMKCIADLGYLIDSSAIPRPKYKWEAGEKNWEGTSNKPYYPSVADYRTSGTQNLKLLEIPISTTIIEADNDTESNVLRYINPAYFNNVFEKSIYQLMNKDVPIVTIMHPYEICESFKTKSLISFSILDFEKNLHFLLSNNLDFKTISDIREDYEQVEK